MSLLSFAAHAMPTFKHIVIIFQENRTPDNLFGSNPKFEPGVDIATSGLDPVDLASCYDIDHSHAAFEAALNTGFGNEQTYLNKGCTLPATPQFKYVDNSTGAVQPYFDIASNYGFANRMFQTNQGPSFPAHQFIFGGTSQPSVDSPLFVAENTSVKAAPAGCISPPGQTVKLIDGYGNESSNAPIYPCLEHQTLVDLFAAASPPVSWRYYAPNGGSIWTAPNAINHICQPAPKQGGGLKCGGPDYVNGDVVPDNNAQVLTDIAACSLQGVSWVIPTSDESDHAGTNNGTGPAWVASIVNAIGQQAACPNGETYWNDTAIIISWDDWGGWYDHVPPLEVNVQPGNPPAWGDGYTFGFRVPMLVVSAYTPRGYVNNNDHDFGSIVYFIERNFGLGFIGGSDKSTYGQYADYYASKRGDMAEFFSLGKARGFSPIPARFNARYFIKAPRSLAGPDND
jgi:phospholipase C